MYHSVYFGEKNTWTDWHLIPSTRPTFVPPPVNTNYIEIPGADGALDFTEALRKRPTYKNREDSFEFIVANDYGDWAERYSEISAYLHGREMNCYLEDDPNFFYHGRFAVDEWKSDQNWSVITINYNVLPYKYDKLTGVSGYSYDPYNLSKGVLNDYRILDFTSSKTETVNIRGRMIKPIITVQSKSSTLTVKEGSGSAITLQNGINYPNIVLKNSTSTLTFTGTAKLILDLRGGRL